MKHQIMHMNARSIYAQLFFYKGLANTAKPILFKPFFKTSWIAYFIVKPA